MFDRVRTVKLSPFFYFKIKKLNVNFCITKFSAAQKNVTFVNLKNVKNTVKNSLKRTIFTQITKYSKK